MHVRVHMQYARSRVRVRLWPLGLVLVPDRLRAERPPGKANAKFTNEHTGFSVPPRKRIRVAIEAGGHMARVILRRQLKEFSVGRGDDAPHNLETCRQEGERRERAREESFGYKYGSNDDVVARGTWQ
jgi:hypothetical protein